MISNAFNFAFFYPLYNGLIFLMDTLPWIDAGVAVILFTIIIKFILFPLSKKSVVTQMKMKTIEPELAEIKKKYSKDQTQLTKATLELYKKEGVNPFASILLILIQLPIIFALYFVFLKGFPTIEPDWLYSFIPAPENIDIYFLGIVDITSKSVVLALLAGITNFFQIRYSMPASTHDKNDQSFKANMARSMNIQMRYVLPIVVFVIAFSVSAAIAIYWTTSNIFAIVQELYFRKKLKKQ